MGGQFRQEICEAVGLQIPGRGFHQFRVVGQEFEEGGLFREFQKREQGRVRLRHGDPLVPGLTEDAGQPGGGVWDVIERVFSGPGMGIFWAAAWRKTEANRAWAYCT